MLNFEPHKPTYKISIDVGRSVVHSENTTHDYSPHAKAFGNCVMCLGGGGGGGELLILDKTLILCLYLI